MKIYILKINFTGRLEILGQGLPEPKGPDLIRLSQESGTASIVLPEDLSPCLVREKQFSKVAAS